MGDGFIIRCRRSLPPQKPGGDWLIGWLPVRVGVTGGVPAWGRRVSYQAGVQRLSLDISYLK